ncbi:MAG: adenosylcobinamide-GDP ribazoletransferase [Ilumatobacteraceae bacterium]
MRNLRAAIAFLTRVPVPVGGDVSPSAAVPWYPIVGALVGLLVGGVAAGTLHLVPPLVAAGVAVILGVTITGAFHEDGLADVFDAFVGGWTRADRMRILKDPKHGSYGVAALCGSIVIRVACVASLGVSPAVAFACVVAAHTLGRSAAVALMVISPTATTDGLGARAAHSLPTVAAWTGVTAGVAITALTVGWWVGPFVLGAIVITVTVGWWSTRKIGGVTGDVLGTAEQLVECVVLVVSTGLASRYVLWWSS